jgi:hypothetical protein
LNVGVSTLADRSATVQDAAIAETVAAAEKKVSDAKEDVDAVTGLGNAASTLSSAQEAYKTSLETSSDAFAEASGEVTTGSGKVVADGDLTGPLNLVTAYDSVDKLAGAAAGASATTPATLVEDNGAKAVVVIDEDGVVKAADGINEDDVTNIDALVGDLQAAYNAGIAKGNALNAYTVAANSVLNIESELVLADGTSGTAITDGILVEDGSTNYVYSESANSGNGEYYDVSGITLNASGEIQVAFDSTAATTDTPAPTSTDALDITDVNIGQTVLIDETDGSLKTAFTDTADLSTAVVTAEAELKTLTEAVERFQNARDLKNGLDAQDDAIKTASDELEELGFDVVDLDTASAAATSDDDVFLMVEGTDSSINNFGLQGEDRLFIGEEYSLVELGADETINSRVGDSGALEIFWKEVAGNLELSVENEAFAGNATNGADVTTITLTGVSVDDINFEGGFVTAGEVA